MAEGLQTRNVFLDTEVFVAENFFLQTHKLKELCKLATEGKIQLLMSTVTVAECKKRIQKMVNVAGQILSENKRDLGILRQAPSLDNSCLRTLEKQKVISEITEKFGAFVRDFKVTICPLAGVSIEKLFSDYISGNPPFGEEQKKDQFPDAAAMLCLSNWCNSQGQSAYVISKDNDIASVCKVQPSFIHLNGVADFLDLFHKTEKALSELAETLFAENTELISKVIAAQFEAKGFIVTGELGEVERVAVNDVSIADAKLISLQDDYARFEATATIDFWSDVTYSDSSTGWYDNEDGQYYGQEDVHEHKELVETFLIEVEIEFSASPPHNPHLTISLGADDIEIEVSDEDPNHWK